VQKPVECLQTGSNAELRRFLEQSINQRVTPRTLELEGLMLKLLGALPPDYRYRESLLDLYTERLSAFYSPEFKRFVLAGVLGNDRDTILAHELTHALQDQHYDLNGLTRPEFSNDVILARTAIFEGDANITMRRVTGAPWCAEGNADQAAAVQQLESIRKEQSATPKFLELQIAFPYFIGEQYLCSVIRADRRGKDGSIVQSLRKVYAALPESTNALLGRGPLVEELKAEVREDGKIDHLGPFGIVALLSPQLSVEESLALIKDLKADTVSISVDPVSDGAQAVDFSWEIELPGPAANRAKLQSALRSLFSGEAQRNFATVEIRESGDTVRLKRRLSKLEPASGRLIAGASEAPVSKETQVER